MVEANANAATLLAADEPVLVGREQELARFNKFLKEGQPLLVVITGGAGVGKSSLLRAFQAEAEAAGWTSAPSLTSSESLSVTPETTEESFSNQVQSLSAAPGGTSFIEKSPGKAAVETLSNQEPLLAVVEQLRARSRVLLIIDGYQPSPGFMEWFQNRFVKDVKRAGASVIIVLSERPEGMTKISLMADEILTLGMIDKEAIRQHFAMIGEKISPPMEADELNVYVEKAYKTPEMLASLTRVLRLAFAEQSTTSDISAQRFTE